MTWSVDAGVQVQNLITTIAGRLTASGWTLTDRAADQVWDAVNDQGVHMYVQITNVGAYQYLQFQGFTAWDTGAHSGSNGSGTTYWRLYYAASAVGATTPVNLYMSVTSNRIIIFIQGAGNYRNFAYIGGLDALAGASDPTCFIIIGQCHYSATSTMLQALSGGTYWLNCFAMIPAAAAVGSGGLHSVVASTGQLTQSLEIVTYPILMYDSGSPYAVRGNLDGMIILIVGLGNVGHLDTLDIDGTTYLIINPGGVTAYATNSIPIVSTYNTGYFLAIAEA